MVKIFLAALILAAAYKVPHSMDLLVILSGTMATIYYWVTFQTFATMFHPKLMETKEIAWGFVINALISFMALSVIFKFGGYDMLSGYLLPWAAISVVTAFFNLALHFGILVLKGK